MTNDEVRMTNGPERPGQAETCLHDVGNQVFAAGLPAREGGI